MGDVFAGKPKQDSTNSTGPQRSNFQNQQFQKLTDGDRFTINNRLHKLIIVGGEETAFRPPATLSKEETAADKNALDILHEAAQTIQSMGNRLADSEDGKTTEGVGIVIKHMSDLSPEFVQQMRGYLLAILKEGDNLDKTRGSVFIPPCDRARFESELGRLPAEAKNGFDWKAWLGHLYDPVPKVTEGFYLFRTKGDWEQFEKFLGAEYAQLKNEVQMLFTRALDAPLDAKDMAKYDETGQRLMEIQKNMVELQLANADGARQMCTRVRFTGVTNSVDGDGNDTLKTLVTAVNYTTEFRPELNKLADQLALAREALPESATELRGVLEAQEKWCRTETTNADWGRSLPEWIAAKDPNNLIDVNLTCEEKVSHIGQKSIFQVLVAQHEQVPAGLQAVWDALQENASKNNVNMMLLRTLIVGGGSSFMTLAGEKLPDPAGEPLYKSMTFTNTTGAVVARASSEAIAHVTGISPEEAQKFGTAALAGVILHEFGHTRGDHAKFLEQFGGFVEETNAQASTLYISAIFSPDLLPQLSIFEACWIPVRRAQRGVLEMHSRSDLVLFDEYLNAGAVKIVEKDGRHIMQVRDEQKLVQTAFRMAITTRLWEKGIPSSLHAGLQERFNPYDTEQDVRILRNAVEAVGKLDEPQKEKLRQQVMAEVKEYFSDARMREIGDKLKPVIDDMEAAGIPLVLSTVQPGDRRIADLVI